MFEYSFMKNALYASILISILYPSIGMFLVLKRQSMIGDTLSHASFAGVALGVLTGMNPVLSAFIFTSIAGLLIEALRAYYKRYAELILVIILTLCTGIAITVISMGKAAANVNSLLFGSILTVSTRDLIVILIISIISLATLVILYDKLIYTTFDEEGARISGIRVKLINYIFALLIGAAISASIRIMGVLILSSMLVVPVAASLQLGKGFKATLVYSIIFGFVDIIGGLIISYYVNSAPGGIIALTSVFVLLIVIILKNIKK